MDEDILAEIRVFAGNFAPRNWALCWGQLLAISSNTALFSLIGTYYGGNGVTNFALPDFRGRIPVGMGQGLGLSPYNLGEMGGSESVTLLANNLPQHSHTVTGTVTMNCTAAAANSDTPQNNYPGTVSGSEMYSTTNNGNFLADMRYSLTVGTTGNNLPINNIQPVQGLNYIICLAGIFPVRS